jgi:hypothetical protein
MTAPHPSNAHTIYLLLILEHLNTSTLKYLTPDPESVFGSAPGTLSLSLKHLNT